VGSNRQEFGVEITFRAGWEDAAGEPLPAARIMLDNCLLYGFDDLARGRAVFLTCTRDTLLSGFLSLMPRTIIFQIPKWMEADDDVLAACQKLRDLGFRLALDDFDSVAAMDAFLDVAHFIKVDFRQRARRQRVSMLRSLRLTDASLIAKNVDSEQDFHQAVDEGFELLQGTSCGDAAVYSSRSDNLDPVNCVGILGALDWPELSLDDLANLISLEPGIARRVLRRANWTAPQGYEVHSVLDALLLIPKSDVHSVVNLAIEAASEQCVNQARASVSRDDTRGDDALIRWFEMGAKLPWWWNHANGSSESH
jgi:EAL and modified HD-GYP domain-containing signal transduction protein